MQAWQDVHPKLTVVVAVMRRGHANPIFDFLCPFFAIYLEFRVACNRLYEGILLSLMNE